MRKSILLISGVGIGAGLLYAFTRGNKNGTRESANGKEGSLTAADENGRDGKGRNMTGLSLAGSTMKSGEAEAEPEIDDRGTGQHEASEILKSIRDHAFDSSDEKLALALGRPTEEIEAWTSGDGTIDGDVVMKARVLADKRGVEIQ